MNPENPLAFPSPTRNIEGMTLHDYFMAHAPTEPQSWFKPMMESERPVLPNKYKELTEEQFIELNTLDELANEQGCPEVKAFCNRFNAALKAQEKWSAELDRQHYLQWPAAWAHAMLEKRMQS